MYTNAKAPKKILSPANRVFTECQYNGKHQKTLHMCIDRLVNKGLKGLLYTNVYTNKKKGLAIPRQAPVGGDKQMKEIVISLVYIQFAP